MEFKIPEVKLAILQASKIKGQKGRKAKNSCFSPLRLPMHRPFADSPRPSCRSGSSPSTTTSTNFPRCLSSRAREKTSSFEAELLQRNRSRQKTNDAFQSLKILEHKKIVQLMDASDINQLEAELQRLKAELEEASKETVTWVHRAETFKAERYQEFAHLIDPAPPPAPPPRVEPSNGGFSSANPSFGVVSLGL